MTNLFSLSPKLFTLLITFFISNSLLADCIYQTELTASLNEDGNYLVWSTSDEKNNQHFIIERSKNGIDFETAGKVKGAGNSDEIKEYSFSDLNKTKMYTRYFYRLVEVDSDGETAFSQVAIVTRNQEEKLFNMTTLSSSTVDRYLNINLTSSVKNTLSYNVQTQMGDILLRGDFDVTKGDNAISVDLNDLEVGRYQMAIKVKNEINVIQVKKVNSSDLPAINLATKNRKAKN